MNKSSEFPSAVFAFLKAFQPVRLVARNVYGKNFKPILRVYSWKAKFYLVNAVILPGVNLCSLTRDVKQHSVSDLFRPCISCFSSPWLPCCFLFLRCARDGKFLILFVHFAPSAFPSEQRAPFLSSSGSKPLSQSRPGALEYKTTPCNI